jgi:hypothetical protein
MNIHSGEADQQRCVSDEPVPPLTVPEHDGQTQYLVRRAAHENGLNVQFCVLPWRRCLQELYERYVFQGGGSGVYFSYCDQQGHLDRMTLHGGEPVLRGEKWIATVWYRQRAYI